MDTELVAIEAVRGRALCMYASVCGGGVYEMRSDAAGPAAEQSGEADCVPTV